MDLRLYPMDVQECPLIIESCKLQFIVGSLNSEDDEGSKNVGRKKLLDGKGPFDDNVFKNPAILLALRSVRDANRISFVSAFSCGRTKQFE